MTDVDVEALRGQVAAILARKPKAPARTPEPRTRPERKLASTPPARSWSPGAPNRQGDRVSTHDHFGFMVRDGARQWCDKGRGGCGQSWVLLVEDTGDGGKGRPPRLYANNYRGTAESMPYGTRSRNGGDPYQEDE